MITGIITAVLFMIVCLRMVEKRILKRKGLFSNMHVPVGIALAIVAIIHLLLTFPLLGARPFTVTVTGAATVILLLAACVGPIIKKMKFHRLFAMGAAALLALHIIFNLMGVVGYQNRIRSTVITNIDVSEIADGVYVGEYDVTFIYAKVEVTVSDHKITDISILEHRNERGASAEAITDRIIDQQAIEADTISGATNSSTVIKKAIENALLTADE